MFGDSFWQESRIENQCLRTGFGKKVGGETDVWGQLLARKSNGKPMFGDSFWQESRMGNQCLGTAFVKKVEWEPNVSGPLLPINSNCL